MNGRATIADVAKESGVSIKTVSNVLNNTGSMRPETRERVRRAMKRLGYRVNLSARAMKTGGIGLLGLAITSFDQPFMPYLADSIVNAARRRGYGVVTDTYGYGGGIESIVAETRRLAADGWIFFASGPFDDRTVLRQPYPLVVVGDYPVFDMVDAVTMPNTAAVQSAVGGLLDAGRHRIALVGGVRVRGLVKAGEGDGVLSTGMLRTRGYLHAHRSRGLPVDERLICPADWTQTGGRDAVGALLDDPDVPRPDAMMCLNDAMAIGAIHELQRRGLRVPDDVEVCGFDNVPEGADGIPALTTVDPFVDDYARHAVDMLIRRVDGAVDRPSVYTTSFDLVIRDSALTKVGGRRVVGSIR